MVFGIAFFKTVPTTYVLHYVDGEVKREGKGLSFFYFAPTSSIVAVPLNTRDVPFAFNEVTKDFQTVTVQGQLSCRVADAKRLAALLNHTVRPNGEYMSDDPVKLHDRLVNETQSAARAVIQKSDLKSALFSFESLITEVISALKKSEVLTAHGVEVLSISIISIKPTPEMGKALEAEAREQLNKHADEAIYDRRKAAVEQERKIKESELNTEIAVEAKRREIRETQMNTEIAVEQQRSTLLENRIQNDKKDADARAYALEATLKPVRDIPWQTLMALYGGGDARTNIAVAFRQLADNAQKIGELNITPDLLNTLIASEQRNIQQNIR